MRTETAVVIVSGACGTGKTETLRSMHDALSDRVVNLAVLETDHFYTMVDPHWSTPWPEASRYFDLALRNIALTARNFIDAEFDLVAIGSNGLCEAETVKAFARSLARGDRVRVHHVTLDPGLLALQQRMANRWSERAFAVDQKKTPEWLEGQLEWFRERYGAWTHVLDNSAFTPTQTADAIYEAVQSGLGCVM